MAASRIDVGLYLPACPPLSMINQFVMLAKMTGMDSMMVWDHVQDFYPSAIWDRELTWLATTRQSPHEFYEWRTLLGYLAGKAGNLRLGVGVTEAVRHHPVVTAQAAMTLAHLTKRAPILGLGTGERENTVPYGLSLKNAVSRLEEALQIIRLCFGSRGKFSFQGQHFQLKDAVIDLMAPPGRTPQIWVAAHGPRMLALTGKHADGWYPVVVRSPDHYASMLATIRAAAREAGRDPGAITPALHPMVLIGRSNEEVRRLAGSRVARFFALLGPASDWQAAGFTHPLGADFRGFVDILPEQFDRATLDDAIAKVPVEFVMTMMLSGTTATVIRKLQEFGEAGLRYVAIAPIDVVADKSLMLHTAWALRSIASTLRKG